MRSVTLVPALWAIGAIGAPAPPPSAKGSRLGAVLSTNTSQIPNTPQNGTNSHNGTSTTQTCAGNTLDVGADQWKSQKVDDWFGDWLKKNNDSFKATSMMKKFVTDFNIGDGSTCNIRDKCQLITSCDQLGNNGNDQDATKVWMVLQSLQNLSDLLNLMYDSVNVGGQQTQANIADLAFQYKHVNKVKTPAPRPALTMIAGALGGISSLAGVFSGGASALAGVLSGVASLANAATTPDDLKAPDPQYAENEANVGKYIGDTISSSRSQLENMYSQIFDHGTSLIDLAKDGALSNRTALSLDCNDCIPKQEAWVQQYVSLKLINQIWKDQSVFITFMPYGDVAKLDHDDQKTKFTQKDCEANFLGDDTEKKIVICDTEKFGWDGKFLGPGMARLTWYNADRDDDKRVRGNPKSSGFLDLRHPPPGSDKDPPPINGTTTDSYKFNPVDAVESSLRGWIAHGFDYDGVTDNTDASAKAGGDQKKALDALKALWTMDAKAPGMFNIPVCVIQNMNEWPTYWSQDGHRGGDYYSACQGSKGPKGDLFIDHTTSDLKNETMTFHGNSEFPIKPGFIWSEDNPHSDPPAWQQAGPKPPKGQ